VKASVAVLTNHKDSGSLHQGVLAGVGIRDFVHAKVPEVGVIASLAPSDFQEELVPPFCGYAVQGGALFGGVSH